MALTAAAEEYFRSMNPIAGKIHDDIVEAKSAYENIWETLSEKEKVCHYETFYIRLFASSINIT